MLQPLPDQADLGLKVPGWRESLLLLVAQEFPPGSGESWESRSLGLIERRLSLQEKSHQIPLTARGQEWREHKFLAGTEPGKGQGSPVKARETFWWR